MFCWDIGIFSFLKKIVVNLDKVSLLSGYVGIQTKSLFFSKKILVSIEFLIDLHL